MRILEGDCFEVLRAMPDNSLDSCVTDPPYALTQDKKGGSGVASLNINSPAGRSRVTTGFMNKTWDVGDIAHNPAFWAEVLRVLKPGGHVAAFGGTRTYHRLAVAIEDAGFEIRDQLQWLYGTGFPKSHNVAVAIDKADGIPPRSKAFNMKGRGERAEEMDANGREFLPPYEPATDAARQWQGWGTALKPANEPICLARKPLSEPTVAANVLKWGTGAINVDGCRVETTENLNGGAYAANGARASLDGDERIGAAQGMFQAGQDRRGYIQAAPRSLACQSPSRRLRGSRRDVPGDD